MDIFSILSYLNKISLLAFIVTAGFLGYQFYQLKKESSPKSKKTPSIPDFNENERVDVLNYSKLPDTLTAAPVVAYKKDSKKLPFLIIGTSLLVLTLGVFIILRNKQTTQTSQVPQVVEPTLPLKPTLSLSKPPTPTTDKLLADNISTTVSPSATNTATPTIKQTIAPSLKTSPTPTEVVLALTSPTASSESNSQANQAITPTTIENLPLTGVIDRSLIFFGVAASLIFIAFIF